MPLSGESCSALIEVLGLSGDGSRCYKRKAGYILAQLLIVLDSTEAGFQLSSGALRPTSLLERSQQES